MFISFLLGTPIPPLSIQTILSALMCLGVSGSALFIRAGMTVIDLIFDRLPWPGGIYFPPMARYLRVFPKGARKCKLPKRHS